jgi:hypothetical protein
MSNNGVRNDIKDFYTEVSQGNVAGYSLVHKYGRNDSIANGVWSLISSVSTDDALPSSGSPVRIKVSGNALDTASGSGAREITVFGIDDSLEEVSETIATSGSGVSAATTASFWRVYRAYTSEVGSYGGTNSGAITIEIADGTRDMVVITSGEGQTQHGAYAIPSGKVGYLLSLHMSADATKAADFRLFTRENLTDVVAPMSPKRLRLFFDGVLGDVFHRAVSPGPVLPALTDVWVEARGSTGSSEVSVDFEILLVDDPAGPIMQV